MPKGTRAAPEHGPLVPPGRRKMKEPGIVNRRREAPIPAATPAAWRAPIRRSMPEHAGVVQAALSDPESGTWKAGLVEI